MVLLTTSLIEKKYHHHELQKNSNKNNGKNYLLKMTHLYMDNKYIHAIGNISMCKNLRVIYLYKNNITKIENLNFAINLTHLYLQHNNIEKIENLNELKNLTHLFLGYNFITTLEGMENLEKLNQLHIEYQHLPPGESLTFDLRTLYALSDQLEVINVTGNNLTSLQSLNCLYNLKVLIAKNNMIDNQEDLGKLIKNLKSLKQLFLQNNPVTNHHKYWKNIISNCGNALINLDDKMINETSRCFMNNFNSMQQLKLEKRTSDVNLSENVTASLNLPPAFKKSVSRAILQNNSKLSIYDFKVTEDGEIKAQIFPSWKIVSSRTNNNNLHLMPRPFWRNKLKKKVLSQHSKIMDSGIISSV
ncbi:protein phosphatase 1 regulatory subunit 42-like [Chelonus insularis]|uniref:protein phosphatase 1 regulatory subunit 42-like n=1 Tax=Chelonus insularis TaxID=460826 RepID=UPI001588E070|nr:protein phosphatase 1 regulatory subunit 42-like [Chelonus insularis]